MNQKTQIIELLQKGTNFIVLGHHNPDGDSLGSMLALMLYLRGQCGKQVFLPAPVNWPIRYDFLEDYRDGSGKMLDERPDSIIILDCSAADRVDWGLLSPEDYRDAPIIVIDHHIEGTPFGDLNWIDPNAAAVGEMVYEMLLEVGAEIAPPIAEALYLAIVTDTGRFTFSNTSARSLKMCADLVELGKISPSLITTRVYCNFSEEYLKNIGIAINNLQIYRDRRVVLLTLDEMSVKSLSTTFDETEGIVDLAMSVRGVEVAALFKEISRNLIRVSLRSKGAVDVGVLASELGGGGHHNAAGCTLKMPLSRAKQLFLDKFEKTIENKEDLEVA